MRITYDPEDEGAAYVYLVDRIDPGEANQQVITLDGNVLLDLDARGRLLGVEILDAKRLLRPETLAAAERPKRGRFGAARS
jgi:uncharacterized protein YuzE